jgi:methylmalonyl-CoA/ethylmalonyl-CoA epimerase
MVPDLGKLAQVAVTFRDLPAAITFYRDVLALPLMFETGGMAFFALGDVRLMMTVPEQPEYDHPASVLYFRVENIAATHAELVDRGVEFDAMPHVIGKMGASEIWMAFFRDTEEHLLAITEERAAS